MALLVFGISYARKEVGRGNLQVEWSVAVGSIGLAYLRTIFVTKVDNVSLELEGQSFGDMHIYLCEREV